MADELKKLNDLKDCGALTQEEFELHKKNYYNKVNLSNNQTL